MDPSLTEDQFDYAIQNSKDYGIDSGFGIRTAKFFIDGSGISFYLNEPFEPAWLTQLGIEAGYRGYSQWTQEELNQAFLKLDSAGIQIHLHCMMDGAVRMAADAFEYAAQFNDIAKNRHTVTHFMLAAEEDLKRLAQMGVIAAIQPMWAVADSLSEENGILMLGEERIHKTYPFGTIKRAGCRITCGTDFPVTMPPSPFVGIQTGITRTITATHPEYEKYKGITLGEGENLTLEDMIEGYSISSAYQCFLESVTGSLEIGKSADFVILDHRLAETPAKEIGTIRAERTFFKGKEVYAIEEDKRG